MLHDAPPQQAHQARLSPRHRTHHVLPLRQRAPAGTHQGRHAHQPAAAASAAAPTAATLALLEHLLQVACLPAQRRSGVGKVVLKHQNATVGHGRYDLAGVVA